MKHRRYEHIVWDWNGTLLDDAWLCIDIMNDILQRRNLPEMDAEKYAMIFQFPVMHYYQKLGFDFETEPFEIVSTEFITAYHERRDTCPLREGAEAVLGKIQESGVSQSVLSASEHGALQEAIGKFDIRDFFASVSGIEDHHAAGKIAIAKKWMASSAIKPQKTLLIGDTLHDYEVATAIGVDCCLVASGHQHISRLATSGKPVSETLETIINIL